MPSTSQHNRFERARIIGSRALQISMGAPVILANASLVDPVRVAETEYAAGVIPITVQKPDAPSPVRRRPEHRARPRKASAALARRE